MLIGYGYGAKRMRQHVTVQEVIGIEGLVLGGGGDFLVYSQVGEEGFDLRCTHVPGMAFVVEEDETLDPVNVGLFCALGIVLTADGVGDLFQQLLGTLGHGASPG